MSLTATLTLSRVEQVAVHAHLEYQHGRLPTGAEDRVILAGIMRRIESERVVALSRMEGVVMLRYLRKQIMAILLDMMALEERRVRGGVDGSLDGAYHALDADKSILDDVVRRLWLIIL